MKITTPLADDVIGQLHAGDGVAITGTIYVGRDAAHKPPAIAWTPTHRA